MWENVIDNMVIMPVRPRHDRRPGGRWSRV